LRSLRTWCFQNLSKEKLDKEIKLIGMLYQQKNMEDKEKSRYIYFSKKAESFQRVSGYI
jgi:hypothetical protein